MNKPETRTIDSKTHLPLAMGVLVGISAFGCTGTPIIGPGEPPEEDPNYQATITLTDPEYGDEFPVLVQVTERRLLEEIGLLRSSQWRQAEEAFRAEIESNKNREFQAEAYFGMGIAQEKQGNTVAALDSYRNALSRANKIDYSEGVSRMEKVIER